MDSDKEFIRAIGAAVTKGILYICLAVTAAFWFSSCQVEPNTIQQCEESCTGVNIYMKSVTSTACECALVNQETEWAVPRK